MVWPNLVPYLPAAANMDYTSSSSHGYPSLPAMHDEQKYQPTDSSLDFDFAMDTSHCLPTMIDSYDNTFTAESRTSSHVNMASTSRDQSSFGDIFSSNTHLSSASSNATLASSGSLSSQLLPGYDNLNLTQQAYPAWPFSDPPQGFTGAFDIFNSDLSYEQQDAQDSLDTLLLCQPAEVSEVMKHSPSDAYNPQFQAPPAGVEDNSQAQLVTEDIFGAEFPDDSNEEREQADSSDLCYAQLLWKCLREAPDHTLSLRELYEWVRQNSQKARDPKNRGWQNSVRHNLSMNQAFIRVHNNHASGKKGSLWKLSDEALHVGVVSTTRYRKVPKGKPKRSAVPAPQRAMSGAKGGQATRRAANRARAQNMRYSALAGQSSQRLCQHNQSPYNQSPMSAYSTTTSARPSPHLSAVHSRDATPYSADLGDSTASIPHSHHPISFGGLRFPVQSHLQPAQPPLLQTLQHQPITDFHLLPIDYTRHGIFTSYHDSPPYTPSLVMSDASYSTGHSPAMAAFEGASREGSFF